MNERVEERAQAAAGAEAAVTILCECADPDCTERIALTAAEYEAAHDDATQFTVAPGHAAVDVEEVVASNERFEIVRKRGFAADVAEELDTP
jgi:3,4-dihydroxy-2-butanone 4-phosphate synthase